MKVDEPDMPVQVTNMGDVEGHGGSSARSLQTQPPVTKAEGSKEKTKETVENSACGDGFKYISTMSSFEDSYFKETVRKELLKDKNVAWRAFSELSPASV
jgi:hypothetical protein